MASPVDYVDVKDPPQQEGDTPSPHSTILGAAPVGASPRVAFNALLRPQTKILPMPLDCPRVMCQQFEKNRDVFVPAQNVQLIQDARIKSPYKMTIISSKISA